MHKRTLFLCASFLAVALVTGCGGKSDEGGIPDLSKGGGPATSGGFDMSKATATVSGKISFEGTPPPNDKIQMASDPYCQMHAADNPTMETVKVSDGGLENVIVFVSMGAPAGPYNTPSTPVEIVQQSCHYVPHVFTIMKDQTLNVKNGDMVLHNIHVWAEKNPQFNVGQPVVNMISTTKFATPELGIPIKCDVHKWMNAFVGVFDNPFNTVSKSGGSFELKLPPGNYEVTAWHEKYGKKTMMVMVGDNDKKEVNFSYNGNDKAAD